MRRDPFEDLLAGPDKDLPLGGTVIRPSLRAFFVQVLQGAGSIMIGLLPFLMFALVGIDEDPGPRDAPPFVRLFERLELFSQFAPLAIAPFVPALRLLFTRYVFDHEGIQVRTALLAKTDQRVPWRKVTAVVHRRGLLECWLGIARIDVSAYGRKGTTIHLLGLRDAAKVKDVLARRMMGNATVEAMFEND